ncbi:MAG: flagellar biosynthesis anti-sigma factor FlgM [Acidobacteria bacterium]|nr:flagellar biosynthesis anti-sigma factor FlgM [Acidobacteriota bacterium]
MRVPDLYGVGDADAGQSAATQASKARQAEQVTPKGAQADPAARAARESDQVQLSDLTERLSQMLGTSDPDRAARLERLAAEVQSGKYQVDAAAVSRKLVDEALRGG